VLFVQGGFNLRLGNSLVWAPRAYEWCRTHGLAFYFPAAAATFGDLIDAGSPLFTVAAEWHCAEGEPREQTARPVFGRAPIADLADELVDFAKSTARKRGVEQQLLSVLPHSLACITGLKEEEWNTQEVIRFVSSHRLCIVNEPFPFAPPIKEEDQVLAKQLLQPSARARSIIDNMTSLSGPSLGIHVRQTDYRRWNNGAYFRDSAFYSELASGALSILGKQCSIFIAHDGEFEPDASLKGHPRVRISNGTPEAVVADFVQFSACDMVIGPQSTFTTQAVRLGESWLPKRRRLMTLRPGDSVVDLLSALRRETRPRLPWFGQ
jgi:hypothetical protein